MPPDSNGVGLFVHFVNEKRDKSPTTWVGHGAEFESSIFRSSGTHRPDHGGEPRPWIHRRGFPCPATLDPHPHGAARSPVARGGETSPDHRRIPHRRSGGFHGRPTLPRPPLRDSPPPSAR